MSNTGDRVSELMPDDSTDCAKIKVKRPVLLKEWSLKYSS